MMVLVGIAALGRARLAYPLMDDQTVFLLGARAVSKGAVLYRDFWDIKPPGIYLFYLAGGSVFGFSEVGIHTFELLYMLAFAATLAVTLRHALGSRAAILSAAFTVGSYYLICDEDWLTLVEPLLGFPVYLSLIGLANVESKAPRRRFWLALAGFATGVVFITKPILIPIPASFLLLHCALGTGSRRLPITWPTFVGAACLPFAALLVWFSTSGATMALLETMFVVPLQVAHSSAPLDRIPVLIHEVWLFVQRAGALLYLAGIGLYLVWTELRRCQQGSLAPTRGLNVLLCCFGWCLTGAAAILLQVTSWWSYQWLLLLCPLCILSAIAVDRMVDDLRQGSGSRIRSPAILLVTLVLALPTVIGFIQSIAAFDRSHTAEVPATQRIAFVRDFNPYYADVLGEARILAEPDALSGPIFVWGNPVIYKLSERKPASRVAGAYAANLTPAAYEMIGDDLTRNLPSYIVLGHGDMSLLMARVPGLRRLLRDRYRLEEVGSVATWYRRDDGPRQ